MAQGIIRTERTALVDPKAHWDSECLFFDSASFFARLEADLCSAQESIDIEVYIFAKGQVTDRLLKLLKSKAESGVSIRLLVDGIGSLDWVESCLDGERPANFEVRVYHPLPWPMGRYFTQEPYRFGQSFRVLSRVNRRDHRKMIRIDGKVAYVGSMNLHDHTLEWRESGVRVEGAPLDTIHKAFLWSWQRGFFPGRSWLQAKEGVPTPFCSAALFNHQRALRKRKNREILDRVMGAESCILLTTPYFVPPRGLIVSLCAAAKRGVGVRLLVPEKLDHPILRWVAWLYFRPLLDSGVDVFEYKGPMLHAKSLVVDQWGMVGSTNLNHRSVFHDLEVDIVVGKLQSLESLEAQYNKDLENSKPITLERLKAMPRWAWFLASLVSLLKGVL